MTIVLQNFDSKDSFLNQESSPVVSDESSNKILYHTKLKNNKKKMKLEINWFLNHNEVDINSCYLDSHIYLSSPSVLPLFAAIFDFQVSKTNWITLLFRGLIWTFHLILILKHWNIEHCWNIEYCDIETSIIYMKYFFSLWFQIMDFIWGVSMNEDILDSRLYWQQTEDYALPVTSWKVYNTYSGHFA